MVLAQIPEDAPGIFNQAVMELGETVCLPNTEPLCAACPVRPFCRGSAGDRPGAACPFPKKPAGSSIA